MTKKLLCSLPFACVTSVPGESPSGRKYYAALTDYRERSYHEDVVATVLKQRDDNEVNTGVPVHLY